MKDYDKHSKDMGCLKATEYLRRVEGDSNAQSKCTKCPFYPAECVEMAPGRPPSAKHLRILSYQKRGVPATKIATVLGVSIRTVYRVESDGR